MMIETPPDDPRVLWQSQGREYPMLSLEDIRLRVQAAQSKIRRNLIMALITGGLLIAVSIVAIVNIPRPSARIIAAGMLALTLAIGYQVYSKMRARRASSQASISGCIRFYRTELEAQYRSVQLSWRLLLALAVFAFLTSNAVWRPNPLIPKILVLTVLLLGLIVRRREAREIQRKLTSLEVFEKGN